MTCYLDRLVPPAWLRSGRRLRRSRPISITPPARPNRPAKPDCPGPSDVQLCTVRLWLLGPSSSNLGAWTCKSSTSAREWHRNTQFTLFHKKSQNIEPGDPKMTPKASPWWLRPCPGRSIGAQSAPKSGLGPSFLRLFLNFLHDLGPRALKVASGVQFWLKTTLRTTKNIPNIHIHFGKLDILRRMTKHATQLLSPFCTNIFSLRKNLQNRTPFKIDCCLSDGPCNCPRYYRN